MMTATVEQRKPKMMVVDDDATFRDRLVAAFAARKIPALATGSPAAARDLLTRVHPDRVVMDLRMPGGSGLELVTDLLKIDPELEIVVLTGYGSIASAIEATRRGAIDYLTKPADADQILAAFERSSDKPDRPEGDGESVLTPSLARVEWEHIQRVLCDCNGNISQAARVLRIHRRSLQRKLNKYPPD